MGALWIWRTRREQRRRATTRRQRKRLGIERVHIGAERVVVVGVASVFVAHCEAQIEVQCCPSAPAACESTRRCIAAAAAPAQSSPRGVTRFRSYIRRFCLLC